MISKISYNFYIQWAKINSDYRFGFLALFLGVNTLISWFCKSDWIGMDVSSMELDSSGDCRSMTVARLPKQLLFCPLCFAYEVNFCLQFSFS